MTRPPLPYPKSGPDACAAPPASVPAPPFPASRPPLPPPAPPPSTPTVAHPTLRPARPAALAQPPAPHPPRTRPGPAIMTGPKRGRRLPEHGHLPEMNPSSTVEQRWYDGWHSWVPRSEGG